MRIEIITPLSGRKREHYREQVFRRLMMQVMVKAEQQKAQRNGVKGQMELSAAEILEVTEKTREELRKKGFWEDGAGVR